MEATALYISSFKSLFLPAAVIGVASRGYMYLRGWSVSDIITATKRKVNNAAASAGKQVGSVLSFVTVSITKRQLAVPDFQKRSLEDLTVTNDFGARVGEVRREIAQLDLQLKDINKLMEGLEGRINEVAHELGLTNQENHRLSRLVVSEGLEGGQIRDGVSVVKNRQLTTFQNRSLEDETVVTSDFQAQVGVVRREIGQLNSRLKNVNEDMEGWERKINEVAEHLDFSIQAILLLSRFVLRSQGLDGAPAGSPLQTSQEQGSLVS